MTPTLRTVLSSLIVSIFLIVVGCSSSQKAKRGRSPQTQTDTAMSTENMTALQQTLAATRNSLSDVYTTQKQDMPPAFTKKDSSNESINSDPFDGYRVQLISTRNQQMADSLAESYRSWADSTVSGYSADAYVFFRQPFYKVHIGDFHEREQANDYSKLIKRKYPDAWVVHDRINPEKVPADTSSFSLISPDSSKADSLH